MVKGIHLERVQNGGTRRVKWIARGGEGGEECEVWRTTGRNLMNDE